jgi:zinc transport system substrate-binding protein
MPFYREICCIKRAVICFLAPVIFFLSITGCSRQNNTDQRISIVVSILPLAEFTEKIGGDRVSVFSMVGPGASPHSYEPTPQQLRRVSEAKLYVKLGVPIEFELAMLDKLIAMNSKMTVLDAGKGTTLRSVNGHEHDDDHGHDTGIDPHIWLSVKNARIMIRNIYDGLCTIDPANKTYYSGNYLKYGNALDSLDRELTSMLSGKENRRFMVYHPSWGYFCDDYGLEQIAVEIQGKEPSAQHIRELIEQAKLENIKIIFASPQFSTKGAEVIARDINGQVVLVDPLAKDYIYNIKKISRAFASSME